VQILDTRDLHGGFLRIYLGSGTGYRGLRAEQPGAGYIGAMNMLLSPLARALSQFDDPVFLGVLARSLAWSIACFIALHFAAIWLLHRLLDLNGAIAWAVDVLGSVGASLLALWLFLPVAAAIGTLYFDRIAAAVEHRYYPYLPPPNGAPLIQQAWDGLALGLKILGLNLIGLILALILPGIGLLLGWAIAAYAIGRGLFVAVAMRRMPYPAAKALYRHVRPAVLTQGAVIALAAYIPVCNLLIPVVGVAAMVHLLDIALGQASWGPTSRPRA
jgi:CysZ protein